MQKVRSPLLWLVPLVLLTTVVIDGALIAYKVHSVGTTFVENGEELLGTLATSLTDSLAAGNYQALEHALQSFVDQHQASFGLLRDREGQPMVEVGPVATSEGRPPISALSSGDVHHGDVSLPDGEDVTEFTALIMLADEPWATVTVAFPPSGSTTTLVSYALFVIIVSLLLAVAVILMAWAIRASQQKRLKELASKAAEALPDGDPADGIDALDRLVDASRNHAQLLQQKDLAIQQAAHASAQKDQAMEQVRQESAQKDQAMEQVRQESAQKDQAIQQAQAHATEQEHHARHAQQQVKRVEEIALKASQVLDGPAAGGIEVLDQIIESTRKEKIRKRYAFDEATDAFSRRALQPADIVTPNRGALTTDVLDELSESQKTLIQQIGSGSTVSDLLGDDPNEGLETYVQLSKLVSAGLTLIQESEIQTTEKRSE